MPLVSILIPAYRVERYLAEAVHSALAQTYENIEIIVINDASPDNTGVLADSLSKENPRIRVIHHEENLLRSGALNTGISEARGAYISFLDADDIYVPEKTEKQISFLGEHPEIDMVYGDYQYRKENGELVTVTAVETSAEQYERIRTAKNQRNKRTDIFGDKFIPSCSALIKREVASVVQFDESLTNAEDLDFWLRIIGAKFNIKRLPFVTYTYRCHAEQKSKNQERMQIALAKIDKKLNSGAYLTR